MNAVSDSRRALRALLCSAGLCIALAGTGHAADAPAPVLERRVAFADLDLRNAQGQAVLQRRIRSAAHHVCAPLESRILPVHHAWQRCVARSLDEARQSLALAGAWRSDAPGYASSGPRRGR